MWINRKEFRELAARVDELVATATETGSWALVNPGQDNEANRFYKLLWAHMDLRIALSALAGKLEAIATRW